MPFYFPANKFSYLSTMKNIYLTGWVSSGLKTMKRFRIHSFFFLLIVPSQILAQGGIDKPKYQVETHRAGVFLGNFEIELFPLIAPLATANFDSLAGVQFYDSTAFHRVVPGFVIQGGDPNSIHGPVSTWGQGNASQPNVPAEFSVVRHVRGILGAARDVDTNSANSQFYICVAPAAWLDGQYTVYGRVTAGMDVVDTIINSPRDSNDVPLQKIEMFITFIGVNDSVPNAPALTVPANQSTGILNTQAFQWLGVNTAVMYTMEFSTDSVFSTISLARHSAIGYCTMPQLLGSTQYYWRVKSNNGGHESVPSTVWSFNTATGAAQLFSPADSSTGVLMNPVMVWNPVSNATGYTLQISKSSIFIPSNYVYNQSGLTDTAQQVSGLQANYKYYWRVRSENGNTQGFYSEVFTFTTGNTLSQDEPLPVPPVMDLSVYPNPADREIQLDIQLLQAGQVSITVKDIHGRVVYSVFQDVKGLNLHEQLDISKWRRGVYVLYASDGKHETTAKFNVE